MATFAELRADVITLTKRPDLVDRTDLAVRAATLKAHNFTFFPRDLFETALEFETPAYIQSLEISALIPQFRALKFLRKYDSAGETAGDFFKILEPEEILDSYGRERYDVAYLSGQFLKIKSSTEDAHMLIGCYLNPVITSTGFSSWIADVAPFAIVYEATRSLFKSIGFDEQAAYYKEAVAEQYTALKANYLLAVGE